MPIAKEMATTDYIFCRDCNQMVDFWKYGHNIADAGHDGHDWRYASEDELSECVHDCHQNYPRCQDCDSLNVDMVLDDGGNECPDCGATISRKSVRWVNCFTDC